MSKDFEPKEQSKSSIPARALPSPLHVDRNAALPEVGSGAGRGHIQPKRHFAAPRVPRFGSGDRDFGMTGFVAAFGLGVVGVLLLFGGLASVFASSNGDRILTGVKAGEVDLSGATREEAIAKLQSWFSFLGNGEVVVNTPVGSATLSYADAGRSADVEAMADAALSFGHSGNGLSDAITTVHAAIFGQSVPVVVHVNPTSLAEKVRTIVSSNSVAAKDAQATSNEGNFSFNPSATGRGMDEPAAAAVLIDKLTLIYPPSQVETGGAFVDLKPGVTDKDAENAISLAEKMVVDVKLSWGSEQTWTISSATIRSWIIFGPKPGGGYGATIDPIKAQAHVSSITAKANIPAVEPSVVWSGGTPVSLTAGKDGTGVDLVATTQAIASYLDSVAAGSGGPSPIEVTTKPISPQITNVENIKGMVIVGKWTTTFYPGESNGNGANITVPAKVMNGIVVGPGQQFSFLRSVGPIDEAHGFAKGGVIVNGVSNHTGAMGGGICSASTTFFNAAAVAGLRIDERRPHAYYINRYPVGRDATVYSNGISTYDMKWTNDTPYPIVIRSYATQSRSTGSITVQLWSLPIERTVTWTGGTKANEVKATDGKRYVSTLAPGKTYRQEYPTDGFDTSVTRVVKDKDGVVLHTNTWLSHYVKVNGVLQIGGSPAPSGSVSGSPVATQTSAPATPTPAPTPTPTPAPTLAPEATPTPPPAARRRRTR
jgi:vancomycin resistance protein YoaR